MLSITSIFPFPPTHHTINPRIPICDGYGSVATLRQRTEGGNTAATRRQRRRPGMFPFLVIHLFTFRSYRRNCLFLYVDVYCGVGSSRSEPHKDVSISDITLYVHLQCPSKSPYRNCRYLCGQRRLRRCVVVAIIMVMHLFCRSGVVQQRMFI